jgi:proline racemase/trans-L-3-hydroxyproline dehydratase
MDPFRITDLLAHRFPSQIITIDSHTAGEPTRLIVSGVDPIPGETMKVKRSYFMENLDHIRLQLVREPRGHRDMFAALVTEAVSEGADFGLIYMDARRYPFLCGHATIGAVTTLIEAGALTVYEPETIVVVDTPSGPMETKAHIKDGKVESVAMRAVPSFVYRTNEPLDVPGLGRIEVDTVCVGGFFAMVSADQIGMDLVRANGHSLTELGMTIIEEANRQLGVRHPIRSEVTTVDVVEFYHTSGHSQEQGTSVVIYGESHMDRSPCGTGTTAKVTLLHHRGLLGINQPYFNSGPLGTTFEGRVITETKIGDFNGVVVEIRGSAHITGIHQFVLDPGDPFPEGFLL